MYRLTADYHTHTVFSHGTGTVADNLAAARARGLSVLGISDHGPGHLAYGVRDLAGYLAAIQTAQAESGEIQVLPALELNLLSLAGDTDMPREGEYAFVILGYHKFVRVHLDSLWHFYVSRLTGGARQTARTTDALIRAMERGGIHMISHPGYGMPVDVPALAAACRAYDVLFELNNSHTDLTHAQIHAAASQGARFALSSDAHAPERVGVVDGALAKALEVGLTEREIVNIEKIAADGN